MKSLSSKNPYSFVMFGWSRQDWIFSYRVNWFTMFSSFMMALGTVLSAHTNPVALCLSYSHPYFTTSTVPNLPLPSSFPFMKSVALNSDRRSEFLKDAAKPFTGSFCFLNTSVS